MTDYLYYKKNFKGQIIQNKDIFEKYSSLALRYIDTIICHDTEYQEESIYDCICALAEELFENGHSGNIKSESIDGYSITYSGDFYKSLYNTAKLYLPKELLYRGISK